MDSPRQLAGTYRILIVDDEEGVRDVLGRVLRESGVPCEIETAENGVTGCMRIPVFRPHLIVLDAILPELDGAELCHVVRVSSEFAHTRLLLVTGNPDDPRVQSALDAGADDWIAKPVDLEQFVAKVAGLLGSDAPAAAPGR